MRASVKEKFPRATHVRTTSLENRDEQKLTFTDKQDSMILLIRDDRLGLSLTGNLESRSKALLALFYSGVDWDVRAVVTFFYARLLGRFGLVSEQRRSQRRFLLLGLGHSGWL